MADNPIVRLRRKRTENFLPLKGGGQGGGPRPRRLRKRRRRGPPPARFARSSPFQGEVKEGEERNLTTAAAAPLRACGARWRRWRAPRTWFAGRSTARAAWCRHGRG